MDLPLYYYVCSCIFKSIENESIILTEQFIYFKDHSYHRNSNSGRLH